MCLVQSIAIRNPIHQLQLLAVAVMSLSYDGILPYCVSQEVADNVPAETFHQAENNTPILSVDDAIAKNLETLNQTIQPSIATIRVQGRDGDELSIGTGFVISADGQIVTNAHVIGEGRAFTVELPSGRLLPVLAIEASDALVDLAILKVEVHGEPLKPLELSDQPVVPGMQIAAFGNPLGLRNSIVSGIVSAVREVQGRELIQLAMPTQPGNSGGPLVDLQGKVRGIINMKSAIDDNLGFAIPIPQLSPMLNDPHPVQYDRWVTLGRLDSKKWQTVFGANWQQQGGIITAQGTGKGFGGRSLCLNQNELPAVPFDIAVDVRLDDESGAAGIAFHSDGGDLHYGFYPSNSNLRITCFKGSSVYSWEVLYDSESRHYRPGKWNRLRVRVKEDGFECFVNERLVSKFNDQQLSQGKVGLVKFRSTQPQFRRFATGKDLASPSLNPKQEELIADVLNSSIAIDDQSQATLSALAESNEAVSRELDQRASILESRISQLRRLADDVRLESTLSKLAAIFSSSNKETDPLLKGALLIAKLDNDDSDPESYMNKVNAMAQEILEIIPNESDTKMRRDILHRYLFEENGYHGGLSEYYHRANSHLDRVIDEREGLPITLSILYLELAKRIDLDVAGIGLPGHFVVQHRLTDDEAEFIDVFEKGRVLSEEEAAAIVMASTNRAVTPEDIRPQTDLEILTRVLNNLLGSARRNNDTEAYRRYCEALVAILPDNPEFRIMRSQARAITKRYSGAIEDVEWLIEKIPEGVDKNQALRLRDSLISDQAKQNSLMK